MATIGRVSGFVGNVPALGASVMDTDLRSTPVGCAWSRAVLSFLTRYSLAGDASVFNQKGDNGTRTEPSCSIDLWRWRRWWWRIGGCKVSAKKVGTFFSLAKSTLGDSYPMLGCSLISFTAFAPICAILANAKIAMIGRTETKESSAGAKLRVYRLAMYVV